MQDIWIPSREWIRTAVKVDRCGELSTKKKSLIRNFIPINDKFNMAAEVETGIHEDF